MASAARAASVELPVATVSLVAPVARPVVPLKKALFRPWARMELRSKVELAQVSRVNGVSAGIVALVVKVWRVRIRARVLTGSVEKRAKALRKDKARVVLVAVDPAAAKKTALPASRKPRSAILKQVRS